MRGAGLCTEKGTLWFLLWLSGTERQVFVQQRRFALGDRHVNIAKRVINFVQRTRVVAVRMRQQDALDRAVQVACGGEDVIVPAWKRCIDERKPVAFAQKKAIGELKKGELEKSVADAGDFHVSAAPSARFAAVWDAVRTIGSVLDEIQSRVAVVLVRARNALNIGAAARAMQDFGFADLRIVNEYEGPFAKARSAVDAEPVLAAARRFTTVADAIADCTLVFGTSALGERRLLQPVDVLRDAAVRIREEAPKGKVALLFGSEKTGISATEMSYCHRLLTIPMSTNGISMNLGQAVAVCLYELAREAPSHRVLPEAPRMANGDEIARLEGLLREVLLASEYDRRFPGNVGEDALRRLIRRRAIAADDVEIALGMLRRILWKLRRSD